nr:MAG TPA_asm: hypothetical protein [Caudoviricetes sp.]
MNQLCRKQRGKSHLSHLPGAGFQVEITTY